MKPREKRQIVLIPARMRWERAWVPASLRDVSSRGMMLRTHTPPPPGTYVDIELANRIVTGRVVWSNGQCCGFRLQDRFDLTNLRGGTKAAAASPEPSQAARVATPKDVAELADRSRRFSSAFQFIVLIAVALGAGGLLASEAYHALAAPLDAVKSKLG